MLALRHYITRQYIYIKDVLEADETSSIYQDNILQVQDTTLHRILRIVFHTQNLLHTDAFAQKLIHTGAFTYRDFYTRRFYTQKLLHTEGFTQTLDTFTRRCVYTQRLLHTDAFTYRSFYTQKRLHTEL